MLLQILQIICRSCSWHVLALTQHVALYKQVAIWGSKLRFSKRDPKASPSSEIFRVRNVQMHEMNWAADRLSINRDISSALSFPTMSIVYDVWGGVTCVTLCNICKSYDHRNDDSWHESLWRVAWKHGTSRNTSTATTATTATLLSFSLDRARCPEESAEASTSMAAWGPRGSPRASDDIQESGKLRYEWHRNPGFLGFLGCWKICWNPETMSTGKLSKGIAVPPTWAA